MALDEERIRLTELASAEGEICWERVLFCIKETVYKAWFPLTRARLGFEDAAVTLDPSSLHPAEGAFSARLRVSGPSIAGAPLAGFSGRWLVSDGLVVAAVTTACREFPGHSRASSFGV